MRRETYLIKVLTPLHVGAGQGLSHIDLPIVREVHTGFPFVPGSAIKGCLREYQIKKLAEKISPPELDKALQEGKKPQNITEEEFERLVKIFGTAGEAVENGTGGAGKVFFTDAKILFFPVKSLKGIFQLITCPYVINRYLEDIGENLRFDRNLSESEALVYSIKDSSVEGKILLEEFVFEAKEYEEFKRVINLLPLEDYQKNRVVCINDSIFSDMVQTYTEVQTHIKIDPKTGTASGGALWIEEYLPAESVLYFSLFFEEKVDFEVHEDVLHLGGDVTTGKGYVKIRRVENEK
ncbi:CRISPR-associated protein Cmr4 [Hydrogenivirga caldilitoris]|uniref:CRISPR-associated protein Cmr4 n=1 Tax=Hydrogenivirga caldilitoris TaxID=246264 RepID=A0A497XR77_9AQUI|nr:type III-B CRISPR module RAMP protein Cmr4 [Hydrogenivirga caldilitoris]RLJ70690.1 CRISPR-associated protein Cmr4 [Hydrogenivirga caldilitoris]